MTQTRYVHIVSLGCPKNWVDTEVLTASLARNGFGLSPEPDDADIFLVNTCAFIQSARDEATEIIEEALEWKQDEPDAERKVVVTGCLTHWDKKRAFSQKYPDVDAWLTVDDAENIGDILWSLDTVESRPAAGAPASYLYDHDTPRMLLTPPHYAYLKIADGCDNRCAYCAIPAIRGDYRERSMKSILTEAENLLENGVKELIVIAQDTTAYGCRQNDGSTIATLLNEMDKFGGKYWIRLMYTHPAHFSDELIETFANAKHLVPYVEMPLQHISDNMLSRMSRKGTSKQIREVIGKIRKNIENVALRTTFIVGFPGETERNFRELADFVSETRFERLGVFTFQPEPDTPAFSLSEPVPAKIAESRRDIIMTAQADISKQTNERLIGQKIDVIVDDVGRKSAVGRSWMDAPDIDNTVTITPHAKKRIKPGKIIKVSIHSCDDYELKGVAI